MGDKPKPRVLLAWAGRGDLAQKDAKDLEERLAPFAPTIRLLEDGLYEVRHSDYDVLVTDVMDGLLRTNPNVPLEPSLFVVTFVSEDDEAHADRWILDSRRHDVSVVSGHLSETVEAAPDDALPESVQDLVWDRLLPHCHRREWHSIVTIKTRRMAQVAQRPREALNPSQSPEPFITAAGEVVAGSYQRSPESEGWVLPQNVPEPERWIAAALRHWAIKYRRFPVVGGWWELDRWQTSAEATASREFKQLKDEFALTAERYEEKITTTNRVHDEARTDAAAGSRRLLTEKGVPLASAVDKTLGALGYVVKDVDREALHDAAGKAEDFRVVDPDDPTFDPVIEVKGYDRGAKASDVWKLLRHENRATNAGGAPSALWWIVNHFRFQAPDDRPRALDNEQANVDAHAAKDPPLVIIDTRDLFQALRAIEDGSATRFEVRASLRSVRGWWSGLPSR